jgi:hypothetical protein
VGKWKEDFAWLQRAYPKREEWKGRVGESPQTLVDVLEFEKSVELKIEHVCHYASLNSRRIAHNEYLTRIGGFELLQNR